ncbi:MAG: hypothetical protein R3Y56_10890 [Akkermansia sp.]
MNTEQIPQEYSQLAEKIITELSSNVMELMSATGANNFRYMTAQHIKDVNAFLRSEESKKTKPLDNPIGGLMFTIEPNLIDGGITEVIVSAFPDDMRVLQFIKDGRSLAKESELVKSFELCATWEELTDTFTSIMPRPEVKGSKFSLGQVVITANANTTFTHEERLEMLHRHVRGDWGDCGAEDSQTNEEALTLGNRIMSVYNHPKHTCWIITERDRSVTTILLPEEY